ncbi:MAG TPA: class I SAM-dependent methyltransferase [Candidatus Saccharimonadales bacterium]|nr:class I SAM-dependent methyltransferase [Candidatus Saccharimonadales bacterium]
MSSLTEEEEITKQAYEKAADAWADYFESGGGWALELKKFHKLLPKGKILEIGAGTGRDARDLTNLGYDYLGTDVSDGLLDIARKNCPGQKFMQMSLYDLEFPEKFDGFWCSAVLLHVPKSRIDGALQKIRNTQKRGAIGFISIKDGDAEEMQERDMNGVSTKRFFALWRKDDFEKVLEKNGFKILDYGYREVTKKTNWHMFIVKAL